MHQAILRSFSGQGMRERDFPQPCALLSSVRAASSWRVLWWPGIKRYAAPVFRVCCGEDLPLQIKNAMPGKPALFSLITPSTGSPMETPIGEMMARMTIPVNILGARVNPATRPIPACGPGNVATGPETIPGLMPLSNPFPGMQTRPTLPGILKPLRDTDDQDQPLKPCDTTLLFLMIHSPGFQKIWIIRGPFQRD